MFDLQEYDDTFAPTSETDVENLTDGEYDFEVKEALVKDIESKGWKILEMKCLVLSPGKHEGDTLKYAYFIKDRDTFNKLGATLKMLGFDSDQWNPANGRRVSEEFPKAVLALKGLHFAGKKASNLGKDAAGKPKTWHNFYINRRLDDDGLPRHFGPDELNAAAEANGDPF